MTETQKRLAEYAKNGSEPAFRELVARYINLVYSTALRLVDGDKLLAEDVVQTVFIGLARRGRALSSEVMLGGWLHQYTYHMATKALRAERRRQAREREAMEMHMLQDDSETGRRQIAPILDEAIAQLGKEDRHAILLRFFEQLDFRSVGDALGSNEDAARMRVKRALEKLHALLKQRGVTLSASALGTWLAAEAVSAAPAGLAATISTAALAGAGSGTLITFLNGIIMTKLQASIIGAMVAAGIATTVFLHQLTTQREENLALRRQISELQSSREVPIRQATQVKIEPRVAAATVTNKAAGPSSYQRLMDFIASQPEFSREQIEAYVQRNRRNTESLLAAFRVSHDLAYLKEAAANAPNDPSVQFAVIASKAFPNEQRKWIDAFKTSAPENALAWYFSAVDYFKSGQPAQAIQELTQASRRQFYGNYSAQTGQAVEEMCAQAGWPELAAKAWSSSTIQSPYLTVLKDLANESAQARQQYLNQGDAGSANAMASLVMEMGDQLRQASHPIDQLVGIAAEKKILAQLDPAATYDFLGRPISEVLQELDQQKALVRDALATRDQVLPTLDEKELNNYCERLKLYGEAYALQWLQSKYGKP